MMGAGNDKMCGWSVNYMWVIHKIIIKYINLWNGDSKWRRGQGGEHAINT